MTNNMKASVDVAVEANAKDLVELRKELSKTKEAATDAGKGVGGLEKNTKDLGKTSASTSKQTAELGEKTENLGEKTAITTEHVKAFIAAYLGMQTLESVFASIADTDSIGKLSDRLGVATEELSGLEYAAGLAGMEADKFRDSLKDLTKNSAEAAAGTGEAVDSFRKLGINLKDANGNLKTQPVLIREVADSIIKIKSDSEQAAVAMKIFGESGLWMLNLLKTGSKGIDEAVRQAHELGIVVTSEQAKQAAQTADDISRMEQAWGGVRRQLSMAVAPAMSEVSIEFRDLATDMAKFLQTADGQETIKNLVDTLAGLAKVGAEGIGIVAKLTAELGDFLPIALKTYLAIKGFGLLGGVFGALSGGLSSAGASGKDVLSVFDKMKKQVTENTYTVGYAVNTLSDGMGGLSGSTATVEKSYKSLSTSTVSLKDKMLMLSSAMPQILSPLGLLAAATYAAWKVGEKLTEGGAWLIDKITGETEAAKNQTKAMKEVAEAMEITRKSAEQLNNMSEPELTDEYARASKEVRTLNLLLTQMKISEEPRAEIEAIAEKLKVAKEYMLSIKNTGFNMQNIDDFKGAMSVLDETLKKSGEELAKNIDAEQKVFELKYKQLSLYGQENQARQAESDHYRNIITEISGRYLTESRYINDIIADVKHYASTEKATSEEVKKMAADVMNKKIESVNKYKSVLLSALDVAIQKEKAYKSELESINQAILANSKDTDNKLKELAQGWMTEAQVAYDNYYRAFQQYNEAEQLMIKAKTVTDKEEKEKLKAQANEYLSEAKNGMADYAKYIQSKIKEIQASASLSATNTASIFDTAKQQGSTQINELTKVYNEAVAMMLKVSAKAEEAMTATQKPTENSLKSTQEDVKALKSTLDTIQDDLSVTFKLLGLDALSELEKRLYGLQGKVFKTTVEINEKITGTKGYFHGGLVSSGGYIPGWSNRDVVNTKLALGEYVHTNKAVAHYGVDVMHAINRMQIPKDRLAEALAGIRKPMPMPYIPDISTIKSAHATQIKHETASFEIIIGDARLQATTAPDMLSEFEKQTRRQKLCLVKRKKI